MAKFNLKNAKYYVEAAASTAKETITDSVKEMKDSKAKAAETRKNKAEDEKAEAKKTEAEEEKSEANKIGSKETKKSDDKKDKPEKKLSEYKKAAAEEHTPAAVKVLSTDSAIKIIYFMMAADGEISKEEEDKFAEICLALDPGFADHKEALIKECKKAMDKALEPEDYYDTLRDGIEEAILSSNPGDNAFITPKLLLWDLLTIAYSDNKYHDDERKLMKFIVRKLDVDKSVFLEMESSIETLMDLEDELAWIKTTDRPYLTIEAMVNEIADRKNVIFSSVKELIAL